MPPSGIELMLKAMGIDPKKAMEQLSEPLKRLSQTMQSIDSRLTAIEKLLRSQTENGNPEPTKQLTLNAQVGNVSGPGPSPGPGPGLSPC